MPTKTVLTLHSLYVAASGEIRRTARRASVSQIGADVLSSLVNADDIHKTSIGWDLALNLNRCMQVFTPPPVRAYWQSVPQGNDGRETFSQLVDGRGANTPVSLSSIQCFGAAARFRCFLGPPAMAALGREGVQMVPVACVSSPS